MNIFVKFDNWLARGFDPNPANRNKLDQWLLAHSALARRCDAWVLAHTTYRACKWAVIVSLLESAVVFVSVFLLKSIGYLPALTQHEALALASALGVVMLIVPVRLLFFSGPKTLNP